MRNICTILVALIALSGLLAAQACLSPTTFQHTLPAGFENTNGAYNLSHYPFTSANNTQWQFCYSWTQFVHQVPIAICEIAFRHSSDISFTGGTYAGVDITLASSLFAHNAQSGTFLNNLDPLDQTLCLAAGSVVIPAYTAPATPGPTAPFNVNIQFTQPFFYNPALQKDLVIDITVAGATPVSDFMVNGVFPNLYGSHNGNTSSATAGFSDWQHSDACAIIEVKYSLGHGGLSTQFDLIANTSGGGAGDLTLAFVNIPAGTVEGYTFISTIPYTAVVPGAEFGRAPWFGIFPDPLTFYSLVSPLSLGNPFHWTWPSASPFFPGTPIILPTGVLSSLAGQTWELVGVAMGPAGTFLGNTAPAQLAW